jgi:hypothetical protein
MCRKLFANYMTFNITPRYKEPNKTNDEYRIFLLTMPRDCIILNKEKGDNKKCLDR